MNIRTSLKDPVFLLSIDDAETFFMNYGDNLSCPVYCVQPPRSAVVLSLADADRFFLKRCEHGIQHFKRNGDLWVRCPRCLEETALRPLTNADFHSGLKEE